MTLAVFNEKKARSQGLYDGYMSYFLKNNTPHTKPFLVEEGAMTSSYFRMKVKPDKWETHYITCFDFVEETVNLEDFL